MTLVDGGRKLSTFAIPHFLQDSRRLFHALQHSVGVSGNAPQIKLQRLVGKGGLCPDDTALGHVGDNAIAAEGDSFESAELVANSVEVGLRNGEIFFAAVRLWPVGDTARGHRPFLANIPKVSQTSLISDGAGSGAWPSCGARSAMSKMYRNAWLLYRER